MSRSVLRHSCIRVKCLLLDYDLILQFSDLFYGKEPDGVIFYKGTSVPESQFFAISSFYATFGKKD